MVIGAILAVVFNKRPKTAQISVTVPANITVNQPVEIPVFIDTHDYTINAAEIYLRYDPKLVSVESISKEKSFFQLWITDEPKFSNQTGELSFAGGLPTPGFKGKGQVGTVTVTLFQPQATRLTFEEKTRILVNDGEGTAVPLQLAPIVLRGQE